MIYKLLCRTLESYGSPVRCIYERNEAALRLKEGLEQSKGYYEFGNSRSDPAGPPAAGPAYPCEHEGPVREGHVLITENGVLYDVDYVNGQKTGFFLDQKYNRQAAARIAKGKRVLDCFTDTGSFALNAAFGGAEHVHAVDISAPSIEVAKSNAVLNGLENRMSFQVANVFDLLPELEKTARRSYDMIILDPPAFTKSRKTISSAERGYKEINYRAMKILPRGGYLATCSCSHFMAPDLFAKTIAEAAHGAHKRLRRQDRWRLHRLPLSRGYRRQYRRA